MAYLLKSNVSVNDPDNLLPYYTKYGMADFWLKQFIEDMSTEGYSLEQAEFNALNTFIETLKTGGVWDKVTEVYPMMGNSFDTFLLKLKSKTASRKMVSVQNFSIDNVEVSNGKVIGKASYVGRASNAPRLDTGLLASDIFPEWSIHWISGESDAGQANNQQNIFGCTHIEDSSRGTGVGYRSDYELMRLSNNSAEVSTGPTANTSGTFQATAINGDFSIYKDSQLIGSGNISSHEPTLIADNKVTLFARQGFGTNTNTGNNGWSGRVPIFLFTEAITNKVEIDTIHNAMNTLCSSLGKL